MKKTLYIVLFLIIFPSDAFASERWELRSGKNTLSVSGVCSEKEVRFDLYRNGDVEPIYTSGVLCRDGAFEFSDDLLQWESLGDGSYELVVDRERKNTRQVVIERPVVPISVPTTSSESTASDVGADSSTPRFLDAFVALQQSLLDMRIRLADSDYPEAVKMSLDKAIDGIDKVAGTMADLMFASESGKSEVSGKAGTADKSLEDAQSDSMKTGPNEQLQESETTNNTPISVPASEEDISGLLSADGLNIAGGNSSGITIESGN